VSYRFSAALLALALTVTNAGAVLLDWNALSWTPGSLSNSYDIDPSSAGNDVTATFSGDTSRFTNDPTTGIATPAIDNTMEGGLGGVQKSLDMAITLTFSAAYTQGVNNVSLTLFGIDLGTVTDTVHSITALGTDGVTVYSPTITGVGPAVQLSGSGANQILTGISVIPNGGAGSGDGNATITFSGYVRSITFTFEDGNTGFANTQMAIGNLLYTPLPEFNAAWGSVGVCTAAILAAGQGRKRRLVPSVSRRG